MSGRKNPPPTPKPRASKLSVSKSSASASSKPKSKASARKPPAPKPPRDGGPEEAASHIADGVTDLAHLARRHRLDMLGFLLDMALMEAREIVRRRGKRTPSKG